MKNLLRGACFLVGLVALYSVNPALGWAAQATVFLGIVVMRSHRGMGSNAEICTLQH